MMKATYLAAAITGTANRYVASTAMKVGAYVVANAAPPTNGARHVTCTRTVVGGADTAGTIEVVGKDLSGQTITETLVPGGHTILVTGTKWFASVTGVTGVGWVTGTGDDTIVVGCDDQCAVADGSGVLEAIVVTETAAGSITVADASGTIAVLKASIAEGSYEFGCSYSGHLRVEPVAASKVTVIASDSLPKTYA